GAAEAEGEGAAADPLGAADRAGPLELPGGYVHVGRLTATGAHAATPTATSPPPAARSSARRLTDPDSGEAVSEGSGSTSGRSSSAGRVRVSMASILLIGLVRLKLPPARRPVPIGPRLAARPCVHPTSRSCSTSAAPAGPDPRFIDAPAGS